jgi:hypothetical protein
MELQDSSVGIAIRLRAGRPEFDFQRGARDFYLLYNVHVDSGVHPASYRMDTHGYFFLGKAAES